MTCVLCQGLMREDHFFDFEGTYGFMWMRGGGARSAVMRQIP